MQKTSIVLQVSVSDGSLNSSRMFTITLSKLAPSQKITFLDEVMQASIPENINKEHNLVSVNPTDNAAITCLAFRILNPSPHFEVGEVSGVLISRGGHPFDREKISNEMVHVEVTQGEDIGRVAVNVTIEDVNDNAPIFKSEFYYKAVEIDTEPGTEVLKVLATDNDIGSNSRIR